MSHYTFKVLCSSCGAVPSYNGHGLCDVCVTGDESERNSWAEVLSKRVANHTIQERKL